MSALATAGADRKWLDIESQIQYAFYTENARELGELSARLDVKGDAEALPGYYAALAYYRLSLSVEAHDAARAATAAERCGAILELVLQDRLEWAEALGLQAACLKSLATLRTLRAPFAAARSHTQQLQALKIEPHNPRVLLLAGALDYDYAHTADTKARGCGELQAALGAFEAARPGEEQIPGWGLAEAYVFQARCALDRHEVAAARDALERALLIAPDFALARRLISRITAG